MESALDFDCSAKWSTHGPAPRDAEGLGSDSEGKKGGKRGRRNFTSVKDRQIRFQMSITRVMRSAINEKEKKRKKRKGNEGKTRPHATATHVSCVYSSSFAGFVSD